VFEKICVLMQWRSNLLIAERYEDLAREYLYPMALYMNGQMLVVRDSDHMIEIWMKLQATRKLRGITELCAKVTAVELPRNGRFRVWVRHFEMNDLGQVVVQSDGVHYCRDTEHGIRGEMAEFGRCSIPEIWGEEETRQVGKN
jgi:hypothetical protein